MALDPKADAALTLHRFGFGPRAGSIAAIAADPKGAVLAELDRPGAGLVAGTDLPGSGEAFRAAFNFQQARKAEQEAKRQRAAIGPAELDGSKAPDGANMPGTGAARTAPAKPNPPGLPQQLYLDEAKARIDASLGVEIGFVERLVWFWSNHFCVSADKGQVRVLCGPHEREAIRPHVLGRFADMLLAVETHPAMLLYLDNVRSIGPASRAGINRGKGLNENLARETLELHTLGVRTVYAQGDVTGLAKVITGWTIVPPRQDPERGGEFTFDPNMHEPGPQRILGKIYPEAGFAQGRAVLADLARHSATAGHIAGKLARHFITDEPPQPLIDRIARRFLDTDGDLREVAKALVIAPEARVETRSKLKRPGEWIIGALRVTGVTPLDVRPVIQAYNLLGEPLWRPPAPKGFSDDSAAWIDGLSERLDVANALARRATGLSDPLDLVDAVLGPLASMETRQAVSRAQSRPQALALLLMAPEFQRR